MNKINEVPNRLSELLDELSELLTKAQAVKKQIQDVLKEDTGRTKRKNLYLHVRMPNGKMICHPRRSDTLVEVIEAVGTERAYHAAVACDTRRRGYPVVDVGHYDEPSWRASGQYGIYVGGNTPDKAKDLQEIVSYLGLSIKVKVLSEKGYQQFLEFGNKFQRIPKR